MKRLSGFALAVAFVGATSHLGCGTGDGAEATPMAGSGGVPASGGSGSGSGGSTPSGGTGGGTMPAAGAGGRGGTGGAMAMAGSAGTAATCAGNVYFPFKVGNEWTYDVIELGVKSTKSSKIIRIEAVPATLPAGVPATLKGKMAFRVETKKGVGDLTVSWQAVDAMRVVRYAEQSYATAAVAGMVPTVVNLTEYWDPSKLRFDETKIVVGTKWMESYKEGQIQPNVAVAPATARTDDWTVVAEEMVTVPAGTYKAIRVNKVTKTMGSAGNKTWWFARCVGKIKEEGGLTELLSKVTLVP